MTSSQVAPDVRARITLDPVGLEEPLEQLVTAAQVAQVWALVLEAQVSVGTADPSDEHAMHTAQEEARGNARTYRSVQLPSVIHQLVLMAGSADLVQSLHEGSVESPESVASFLGELMPIFEEHEQHARDLAAKYESFFQETEGRLEALAGRTHAEIKKISGDDGGIAAKTKELEAMQEEVRKDLDAVISASHKAGSGARKILDTILDIFKDAAKKKGEDDGKSKKEDKPSSGEAAPESSEDVHKGIEDITSGAVGAALQKLRRDRAKVEELYREIAGLKSELATVKKVDSECGAYGRSVREVMRPAQDIADAWVRVVASFAATLEEQAKRNDGGAWLANEISWSVIKWKTVQDQAERLRATVTGN
ncbi:hypothetical protein AB0899_29800 [Streptomyces sp. NPDC007002]|uniref:hypothetical protein n=1 Tax=Streptomyces sp. NPDC007002 TaxID=3156910 RepID=UPI0034553322